MIQIDACVDWKSVHEFRIAHPTDGSVLQAICTCGWQGTDLHETAMTAVNEWHVHSVTRTFLAQTHWGKP